MTEAPPLAGIKVIDLTRYLAGPFCTQILGDYGAEIIKVEPVEGARADLGKNSGKDNYFFLSSNRSKKSVQIDTKKSPRTRRPDALGQFGRRVGRQLPSRRHRGDGLRLRGALKA